jgi:hypothetical protein
MSFRYRPGNMRRTEPVVLGRNQGYDGISETQVSIRLISGLSQSQGGLPFFPGQGAQGQQSAGIGIGPELVAAKSVAQSKVRLACIELENATAAMMIEGRAGRAEQPQIATASSARVGPLLNRTARRATNPIG